MKSDRASSVRPRAIPLPEDEWDEAHKIVRDRILAVLTGFGASPDLLDHVGALRLPMRAAYLLTMWTADRDTRTAVATDVAAHLVAMRLFDDMIDDDSGLDRADLALGLLLAQAATRRLADRCADPRRLLAVIEDNFVTVGCARLRARRIPAEDVTTWYDNAQSYGACFLGCHGTMAAISGGASMAQRAANEFGRGFGMIITIADELRDDEHKHERAGNLGHLLLTGAATIDSVVDLVERSRAIATPHPNGPPMARDVTHIVDRYADDLLDRVLPRYAVGPGDGGVSDARPRGGGMRGGGMRGGAPRGDNTTPGGTGRG
jgi:hypothetical protein